MKKEKKGNDDNSSTMMHLTGIVNKPKGFDNSLNTNTKNMPIKHWAIEKKKSNGMSTAFSSIQKSHKENPLKLLSSVTFWWAREREEEWICISEIYTFREFVVQCSHLTQAKAYTIPIARDLIFVFEWNFKWLSIKLRLNRYRLRQSLSLRFIPLSFRCLFFACDCLLFE